MEVANSVVWEWNDVVLFYWWRYIYRYIYSCSSYYLCGVYLSRHMICIHIEPGVTFGVMCPRCQKSMNSFTFLLLLLETLNAKLCKSPFDSCSSIGNKRKFDFFLDDFFFCSVKMIDTFILRRYLKRKEWIN